MFHNFWKIEEYFSIYFDIARILTRGKGFTQIITILGGGYTNFACPINVDCIAGKWNS